jgi:diacylglycerol kinase family enzyme
MSTPPEAALTAPQAVQPTSDIAVIVNANAGRFRPRLAAALAALVPADRLFLTHTEEEADAALRAVADRGVDTVFAGGGDGTIVGIINRLARVRGLGGLPRIAVLPLGTGNALGRWLGMPSPERALRDWLEGLPHHLVTVPMVQTEGMLYPFGGLGHDAAVLNDYNALKRRFQHSRWWPLLKGIPGYLLAAYLWTIPNYLRRGSVRVRITNLGRPAIRLGPGGVPQGEGAPPGTVLYDGTCTMVGAASTPLLGYGMRFFPYADTRPGYIQLRLLDMSAFTAGMHLIPAWRGTLRHPQLHDWHIERVRVQFRDAMPFQVGGEACGYRDEVRFESTPIPVRLIAHGPPPNPSPGGILRA